MTCNVFVWNPMPSKERNSRPRIPPSIAGSCGLNASPYRSVMPDARSTPPGSVWPFLLITFAVTWACFIPVARAFAPSTPAGGALLLLGTFAPSYVALGLTRLRQGGSGVRALLGRIVRGDVAARWYLFAALSVVTIKLTAALIQRLATGAWPRFGTESLLLIPFAVAISTPVQAGEEIGWRGYALPRLAARMGLAPASIVLGGIWALWHLPLFFVREADTFHQSFVVFAASVTALSVTMAWLYAKTDGALLPVMLLHAATNNTKDIVPSATPGGTGVFGLHASPIAWLTASLLGIVAAGLLVWMVRTEPTRAGRYA
jgi:membrane protease YdiL (CAAX protease family)